MRLLIATTILIFAGFQISELNSLFLLKSLLLDQYYGQLHKSYGTAGYNHYNELGSWSLLNSYDFVIVGAGTSGGVLASRLSENPNYKVLLIEAGKREIFPNDIPVFSAFLQGTSYDWGYTAEPQANACLGMVDQRCNLPKGKGVGGSTLINYMIYNRGNKHDFDTWAANGNPGWSYNDVLPYFKKSENAHLKGLENSSYHGHDGPYYTEFPSYRTPYVQAFLKAFRTNGGKMIDYNGAKQIGVSPVQSSTKKGHRVTVGNSYIEPVLAERPNLHILTEAKVTRVLIDPKTNAAYGVEFARFKKRGHVFAEKEVILSAGGFNSAQLLMLSGIGPKSELERVGIPLVKDLPVGQNIYDHLAHFGPTFRVNTTGYSITTDRTLELLKLKSYFYEGSGMLAVPGGVEALGFIKTAGSTIPATVPDAELIFVAGSLASDQGTGIKMGMRITDEIYNDVYKQLEAPHIDTFSIMVTGFHTKSVGYLQLKDRNPFHWPRIYANYLTDERDVEVILDGIKQAIKIMERAPFKEFDTKIHDVPLPNCKQHEFGTDDYWRCSIRTISGSLHHQVGACKMGPSTDPQAIVSNELKVYGVNRLRVVDTSIIPQPPTSHTAAIALMIGEKAADMIKNEWNATSY